MPEKKPSRAIRRSPQRENRSRMWWRRTPSIAKALVGIVGPTTAVIGVLLGLGVIHPLGGGDNAVAAAASHSIDAGSATAEMVVSVLSPSGSAKGHITARGPVDFRSGQSAAQMHVASGSGTTDAQLIFDPPALYLRYPPDLLTLPGNRPWLRVDLDSLTRSHAQSAAVALRADDPSEYLRFLQASGSVKKIGIETLLGVETTHYSAVVKLSEASAPGALLPRTGPVEVWVEGHDLVRRASFDLGRVGEDKLAATVDLFDFGRPVAIQPPPNSQVADLARLLSGRVPAAPVSAPRTTATSTSAAWAKRANAICARALEDSRKLSKPKTREQASIVADKEISILERELRKVAALPKPSGRESQSQQLVLLLRKEVSLAEVLPLALEFGTSVSQLQALNREAAKLDVAATRIAIGLGAATCAPS
jgi:hypothetical protein